jgi:cytochrome c553
MNRMKSILVAAALLAGGLAHAAVDLEAGKAKAQTCAPCHGPTGISQMPETPSLAGQPDGFLQWQLVFFRSGNRKSPVMQPMAATLKDDDIRNLAAYFSSQKPPGPDPAAKPDEKLVAAGRKLVQANRCASCHKDDFSGTQATARIAGQREDYLLGTMIAYRDGKRTGADTTMMEVLGGFKDDDIKALAHYIARMQ